LFSANGTLQPGEGDLAVAANGTGELVEYTEPAKDTEPSVVNCHKTVLLMGGMCRLFLL